MSIIFNAASKPLFDRSGDVPDVSGALQQYYQAMVFTPVAKIVEGFQVEEIGNPINFRGVMQPFTGRQLLLRPEGERAWTWFTLNSDIALSLNVDDVVIWKGKQTRVMGRKDYALYGFLEYQLCQDWTGSGPS